VLPRLAIEPAAQPVPALEKGHQRNRATATPARQGGTLREMIRAMVSALPSGPESESEAKGKK